MLRGFRRENTLIILLGALLGGWFPLTAQTGTTPPAPHYVKLVDTMVSMRDGIRLHTSIWVPEHATAPLPMILTRTPYGIDNADGRFRGSYRELAEDGYAFAFQDLRGHYGSEGMFVMQRPPRDRSDPKAIDEGSDAWDTMEWLLHRTPDNNGRIGMLGVSYDGWTTVQALMDPHPAFRAASPQASPADMWMGDDFHHQGAFRLSYGFEYAYQMEHAADFSAGFPFDRADTYSWYLDLGPLSRVDPEYFKGAIPTWRDYVAHPDYDAFWQKQAAVPYLNHPVTVPTLNVAGWWDQEDFYGPVTIYRAMEQHDDHNMNFLVVGPWNHGGWGGSGQRLGQIDFGAPTGDWYRETIQRPFFSCHLKGTPGGCTPAEATLFRSGSNNWVTSDAFPRRVGVTPTALYFGANGSLTFRRPTARAAADSFVSDPANPVPYRKRPIQPTYGPGSLWRTWLTEDQRFVDGRPDVRTWQTGVLDSTVTISGEIVAKLFASTSESDADWVVKLIDVYPDSLGPVMGGFELMVANDVLRGRYLDSFSAPRALVPNRVERFTVDLHTQEYTFGRGHRIMVQVQSSWFPVIDRNPQHYVPNIFRASASDFRKATHAIQRSAEFPSHLLLPMVGGPGIGTP
ncbi:MAG: CocE/NonD family hydrolase [Gemmatimonadota bacterium]